MANLIKILLLGLSLFFILYMPLSSSHFQAKSEITSFILKSAYAQTPDAGNPDPSADNSTDISNSTDVSSGAGGTSDITAQNDTSSNPDNSTNTYVGSEGEFNLDNTTASAGVQGENNQNNTYVGSEAEIENENNNEKAMHQETQQDANNVDDAKKNDTIAAEVDVNDKNVGTQSIDNNVSVTTDHPTSDAVSITVNASSQTGPKVLLINLNSTTIDVANIKYIDVRYDGNHITPAANVDEVLHPASSDQPHYAILVTQSGAQILVSIPHFSTHTITVSQINKVMPSAVPEFPFALPILAIGLVSLLVFYRIKFIF